MNTTCNHCSALVVTSCNPPCLHPPPLSVQNPVSFLAGSREEISGQRLWEGSLLLCAHLLDGELGDGDCDNPHKEFNLEGKAVLELGAGTGVVSMLAHGLGASPVVATDGDEK